MDISILLKCKSIWYQNGSTHFISCGISPEEGIQTISWYGYCEQWKRGVNGIIELPCKENKKITETICDNGKGPENFSKYF